MKYINFQIDFRIATKPASNNFDKTTEKCKNNQMTDFMTVKEFFHSNIYAIKNAERGIDATMTRR